MFSFQSTLSTSGDIIQNYGYYVSTQKPHSDTRLNQLKSKTLFLNVKKQWLLFRLVSANE